MQIDRSRPFEAAFFVGGSDTLHTFGKSSSQVAIPRAMCVMREMLTGQESGPCLKQLSIGESSTFHKS
jgi:hypothetical protein